MQFSRRWLSTNGSIMPCSIACVRIPLVGLNGQTALRSKTEKKTAQARLAGPNAWGKRVESGRRSIEAAAAPIIFGIGIAKPGQFVQHLAAATTRHHRIRAGHSLAHRIRLAARQRHGDQPAAPAFVHCLGDRYGLGAKREATARRSRHCCRSRWPHRRNISAAPTLKARIRGIGAARSRTGAGPPVSPQQSTSSPPTLFTTTRAHRPWRPHRCAAAW